MTAPPLAASALFLREEEIRRGIELLHFGHAHLMRAVDAELAAHGLGRAHQRALYFIARQPDLSVTQLLRLLAITKQSLGRVLGELGTRGLVETRTGDTDARMRLLRLTDAGRTLEARLFETLRTRMAEAYRAAGPDAVGGFWTVLDRLIAHGDRAVVQNLGRPR